MYALFKEAERERSRNSQGEDYNANLDPRDVRFEVDIPAEVLATGWPFVLQYLRELEEQVCGGLMTSLVDSLWCQAREESRGRLVCTAMTPPLQRICGGWRPCFD